MPRALQRIALVATLALALVPAVAQASPQALIRDCAKNGRIVGHYSQQDYSQALANLPTDIAEYYDCAGVIRRAQLAAAATAGGARSGPPGGGASLTATANPRQDPLSFAAPSERAAVAAARRAGSASPDINGQPPGLAVVRTSSVSNALPTPLLIALGGLTLIGLAVVGRRAREIVRERRDG